jgi:hypothetical protein
MAASHPLRPVLLGPYAPIQDKQCDLAVDGPRREAIDRHQAAKSGITRTPSLDRLGRFERPGDDPLALCARIQWPLTVRTGIADRRQHIPRNRPPAGRTTNSAWNHAILSKTPSPASGAPGPNPSTHQRSTRGWILTRARLAPRGIADQKLSKLRALRGGWTESRPSCGFARRDDVDDLVVRSIWRIVARRSRCRNDRAATLMAGRCFLERATPNPHDRERARRGGST